MKMMTLEELPKFIPVKNDDKDDPIISSGCMDEENYDPMVLITSMDAVSEGENKNALSLQSPITIKYARLDMDDDSNVDNNGEDNTKCEWPLIRLRSHDKYVRLDVDPDGNDDDEKRKCWS